MLGEKPVEASLDRKPSARKCRDRGLNLGLIGAKQGKIRCANLLPPNLSQLHTVQSSTNLILRPVC